MLAACASDPQKAPEQVGYQGNLKITPDPVRFEDTVVGCARTLTLLLENLAPDQDLDITGATRPNPALRVSAAFPLKLGAGGRRGLEVQFAPAKPGDWSGSMVFTAQGESSAYPLSLSARALEPPPRGESDPIAPLDLVFVLDVSTTMDEMASLRGAIEELFDFIGGSDLDVRFGLTTFVNDVIVHRDGSFLDRDAFFSEFDSQLVAGKWVPDAQNARQLVNFDFAENSLTALYRSATEFEFRQGARRYFLLMTDATFAEPPSEFSDGTRARHGFGEVSQTLEEREIRLFSVHDGSRGQGLSTPHRGRPSLVALTRGTWFELSEVSSGALTLDTLLADLLVAPACD